jgi:H+/Cl- antiporter ClcA
MTTSEFIQAIILGVVGGLVGRAIIIWIYKKYKK